MSDLQDMQARCMANARKFRENFSERARVARERWEQKEEPRVALPYAKGPRDENARDDRPEPWWDR